MLPSALGGSPSYWWKVQRLGCCWQKVSPPLGTLMVPFVVLVPVFAVVVVVPDFEPVPPEKPPLLPPPPPPLPWTSAKMQEVGPFTLIVADDEERSTVPFGLFADPTV